MQQLLDYLATLPDANIRYYKSEIISNIHSGASYLSEARSRSQVAGYFYLEAKPVDGQSIPLNRAVYVFRGILKFVVASAAEAELGALFLNCK